MATNKEITKVICILTIMSLAFLIAILLTPHHLVANDLPPLKLNQIIPSHFEEWTENNTITSPLIINPEQKQLLNELYSELITRTYTNKTGQMIMLSISYGKNQRDSTQVHSPEVCYPGQGFQIKSFSNDVLITDQGLIHLKRLETIFNERYEPVTYWITVGDQIATNGLNKKLIEIKYGLLGEIPDGLLFRVSSIDKESSNAFIYQDKFIHELLNNISPLYRQRLTGKMN